jgi:hypothetical protein
LTAALSTARSAEKSRATVAGVATFDGRSTATWISPGVSPINRDEGGTTRALADLLPSMRLAYRVAPTSGLTTRRRSLAPRGDRCTDLVLCPPPPPRGNASRRSWSEKLKARRTSGRTHLGTAPATFQKAIFGRSRTVACHSLQEVLLSPRTW